MADDDIDASEGLEGQRGGEEQEIGKVDICRFHLLAQSPCWSQDETTKREKLGKRPLSFDALRFDGDSSKTVGYIVFCTHMTELSFSSRS